MNSTLAKKDPQKICRNFDISTRKQSISSEKYYVPQSVLPEDINDKEYKEFCSQVAKSDDKVGMDCFPKILYNDLVFGLLCDKKYRDALMLICQANWGMRFGDLVSVRFCDLMEKDGAIKDKFHLCESKTEHTRKVKQTRCFYNNEAVKRMLLLYLRNTDKKWYDYLFTSDSNNAPKIEVDGRKVKQPLSHTSAEDTIKKGIRKYVINNESNLKLNTHSLRKLYGTLFVQKGTQLMQQGKLESNMDMLFLAQNDFGHSSMAISQRYIGQVERMKETICSELNVGLEQISKICM